MFACLGAVARRRPLLLWSGQPLGPQQDGTRSGGALFLCASAGEYEQAIVLAEAGAQHGLWTPSYVFVSPSGAKFYRARGDTAPAWQAPCDAVWRWDALLAELGPVRVFVVRQELWPGFLVACQQRQLPVIALNLDLRGSRGVKLRVQLALLRRFVAFSYADWGGLDPSLRGVEVGSTKIDRVLARVGAPFPQPFERRGRPVLLVGSAWIPDLRWIFEVVWPEHAQIWIFAHDPERVNLATVAGLAPGRRLCELRGESCDLEAYVAQLRRGFSADVVYVSGLGRLAAAYRHADLAWVGGGVHRRVHNFLEPLAWRLPVAFGPRANLSHEACRWVQAGLCEQVDSPQALGIWLRRMSQPEARHQFAQLAASQLQQAGGADRRILADLIAPGDGRAGEVSEVAARGFLVH